MDARFTEWRNRSIHQGRVFSADGIIDRAKWDNFPRVLFLLKEAYDSNPKATGEWDLCEVIRETWKGPKHKMWRTLAQWAYGVRHVPTSGLVAFPRQHNGNRDVTDALLSSAIVNLKKSGGTAHSTFDDLTRYVENDWDLLWQQIQDIAPDIVICGYTWELIRGKLPSSEQVSDRVHMAGGVVFVDFWHPANQYPNELNYYALCSLVALSGALGRKPGETNTTGTP